MTNEEAMILPLEQIQEEMRFDESIDIQFWSKDQQFSLIVRRQEEDPFLFYPWAIYHLKSSDTCLVCGGDTTRWFCSEMKPHLTLLFQRLIHSNELRLSWLYREYTS